MRRAPKHRHPELRRWAPALFALVTMLTSGCFSRAASSDDPDKLILVDCQLLGQMRKLGGKMSYMGPRQAVRIPASECEIRGGEYVPYDRANYATALKVWQPLAVAGDAKAQVYVGEIYEKGMGIPPDYVQAAVWYQKAAQQGDVQGLNHSAYLYEQGLGVPKDPVRALNLYRQAAGLRGDDLTYASDVDAVRLEAQGKIDSLTAQVEERDEAAAVLSNSLTETRTALQRQQSLAEEAQHEVEAMRKRIRQLQSAPQSGSNSQELDRLKSELADREKQLSMRSAEIDKLQLASADQNNALRDRLAAAEKEDAALQQQLGATQAQATNARSQLLASQAKAKALDDQLSTLRTALKTNEATLAASQEQLRRTQGAQGQVDRAQSDQLKATIAQQQVELERQQEVIATLDTQHQQVAAELARLQIAVAGYQRQHDQDAGAAAQVADTVADLRARLASANTDLLRKTQEKNDLALKLEAAARQLTEDSKVLSATAASAGARDAEVKRLNAQLADREATLGGQRAQLAALSATIDSDNLALKDYHDKINALGVERHPPATIGESPILDPKSLGLGQNYALIIGNSNYRSGHLNTAEKDADGVEAVLVDQYGYKREHIHTLHSATRKEMIGALYDIVKQVGDQDNLLIYYAGHGDLEGGHSYWLPIDADEKNPSEWISDSDITGWISETKARHVLIVVDSCYAGAMTHGATVQLVSNGSPAAERKRMVLLAKLPSRTVLTSGGIEPVLDGGPDGHSIFAHEFIDLLSTNRQVIEVTALYTSLADRVRIAALRVGELTGKSISQVPQIAWLTDAGHQTGGEFLFVPNVIQHAGLKDRTVVYERGHVDSLLSASNRQPGSK